VARPGKGVARPGKGVAMPEHPWQGPGQRGKARGKDRGKARAPVAFLRSHAFWGFIFGVFIIDSPRKVWGGAERHACDAERACVTRHACL
jgi:hypothetical protein